MIRSNNGTARSDRAEQAELIGDAAEYEAADRNHPVARGDVDDGKGGQADGDRADRADDAALDDDGDGQRNDDEQHQLGRAHVLGPFEQTTPEHTVDAHQERECGGDPAGNEQGRPAGTELALEPQLGADPGHEQNDEDGEGPGPHVGRRPVVVDELRDTPPDEPALDRLAILARRHGCRRLLPGQAAWRLSRRVEQEVRRPLDDAATIADDPGGKRCPWKGG